MASAENFDILPGDASRPNFQVSFDLYTPRPHFVVLDRSRRQWDQFLNIVSDNQLAKTALDTFGYLLATPYKNRDKIATLSVHRGTWIQTKFFHCHVCVDTGVYLDVFRDLSTRPPMSTWWPAQKFVTKQWRSSKNPNQYDVNVRNYSPRDYHRDEIQTIIKKLRGRNLGPGVTQMGQVRMVYHQCLRQIGIVVEGAKAGLSRRDPSTVTQLILALEQISTELVPMERDGQRQGCHLCVDLTAKGFPGFECEVFAYIQVSGEVMYKCCPHRDDWLQSYQTVSDDKIYT